MNASEILIDLAQDRYPIGTVAKSALTGTEFTSSGSFILNEDNSIYSVAKQGAFSVYDARMKKWAEVVEQYKKGAPAFCMVSHDGVNLDLFDKCFFVDKDDMRPVETTMKVGIMEAVKIGETVVFSTREAAEKWIFEQKPKSILDGKVAIHVNNEREFKLLMEHYESKGWETAKYIPNYDNTFVAYQDTYMQLEIGCTAGFDLHKKGYRGIPFSDFAAEVGIKVPVFVMTSEDGVPLCEGDEYHRACLENNEKWHIQGVYNATPTSIMFKNPNGFKAFYNKKAAETWILKANKPKNIEICLHDNNLTDATVHEQCVVINKKHGGSYTLSYQELEQIHKAWVSLQQKSDKNSSE